MCKKVSFSFDLFPTAALERILQADLYHQGDSSLQCDMVLEICGVLAKRHAKLHPEMREQKKAKWEELMRGLTEG